MSDGSIGDAKTMTRAAPAGRVPFFVPLFNPIIAGLLRLGVPMSPMTLLTVRGRKTGRARTLPVGLLEHEGRRYLFATFGEVDWVRNLRAAGVAVLGSGSRCEGITAVELTVEAAAPVLRSCVAPLLKSPPGAWILRPRFSAAPDAPLSAFLGEARRHPVFEVHRVLATHGDGARRKA